MSDILKGRMPVYVCHKEVRGAKITGIRYCYKGTKSLLILGEINSEVEVDTQWYARHAPQIGGYYVLYEDGYASYSPERAFEDGYKLKAKKFVAKNPPKGD
jgi:hypothetical protein